MIFVTVGTTPFPFHRIRGVIERVLSESDDTENIIFQHGATPPVIHTRVRNFPSLPYVQMERFIKSARIVICHGGPATIFLVHSSEKIPFVLPREKKFHEHVDNHQVFFTNFMKASGRIRLISELNTQSNQSKLAFRSRAPDYGIIRFLTRLTNM